MAITSVPGLQGLRVIAFESQRHQDVADLIVRHSGEPRVVPSLRRIPLKESQEAFTFAEQLLSGQVDTIVFFTGVGLQTLVEILETKVSVRDIIKALTPLTLVSRGPKPAAALRDLGLPSLQTAEPNTWREVLKTLDAQAPVQGRRVAVLESGIPNIEFLKALEERGASVARVPVYRWSLPEDPGPLQDAVRAVATGQADVLVFTSSLQVNHVMQTAQDMELAEEFQEALKRVLVASIGPLCSDRLAKFNLPGDFEPSHPDLKVFIAELAENARARLEKKRAVSGASAARATGARGAMDSLFLRACRRESTERTPVWLMRQAGRYMKNYRDLRSQVPMLELCRHPDLVAQVTVDAVQQLGVDAAIIFSDLLLVVEPLGFELEYSKGEGPLIRPPIRNAADVKRLRDVDVDLSLGFVLEAIGKTRASLPRDIPLLGFAGAPFTVASYLIEGESSRNYVRTKSFMYREPKAWDELLSKISRCLTDFLNRQVAAGAQAVQVFDSWVGCLSPADYQRFVLPHSRAVLRGLKPGVPVIHFGTQTGALLGLMKEAGGSVIGLDWRVNLAEAWQRLGSDVAVMGNLDPVVLFSSPEEIRAQAKRILDEAAGRPGHVFNLGHGILPETPVENVRALVRSVKELSAR
jgi:uroporphyrinogen decarboxylase